MFRDAYKNLMIWIIISETIKIDNKMIIAYFNVTFL